MTIDRNGRSLICLSKSNEVGELHSLNLIRISEKVIPIIAFRRVVGLCKGDKILKILFRGCITVQLNDVDRVTL